MAEQGAPKKTRGRQKIEIKPIVANDTRLVTFSKRKGGIFKKATELSNLCGADVGIVIFSPAGKAFAFGSPSIEKVSNRFLNKEPVIAPDSIEPSIGRIMEAHRKVRLENLSNRYNELMERLRAAKERYKSLKRITDAIQRGNAANNVEPEWWDVDADQPSYGQLANMAARMDHFCDSLSNHLANH